MDKLRFVALATAVTVVGATALGRGQAGAPHADPQKPKTSALRTAWDTPDLNGLWDFASSVPLERPERYAGKATLTNEDIATAEREARERAARPPAPPAQAGVGNFDLSWLDIVKSDDRRTSLIMDPPDGKIPALKPGAVKQVGSPGADLPGTRPVRYRTGGIGGDGFEDRGISERCLVGYSEGPPMTPGAYNSLVQIFQTRDKVALLNEMVHDTRTIPLDGRPHLPTNVRQWLGDSRGHWEGDTLVVDSTNFTDRIASFNTNLSTAVGTGAALHLTERFTRVDEQTLRYEFTIDDPETFTRPFTVMMLMKKSRGLLYEFACHEGNYALPGILRGARAQEAPRQPAKP